MLTATYGKVAPPAVPAIAGARCLALRFLPAFAFFFVFDLRLLFHWQQLTALDVHERRSHDEKVTRKLEIVLLLRAQDLEVLLRDLLDRDVVDIDLVLADQEQEQVQRG